jgi:hypothetical protein
MAAEKIYIPTFISDADFTPSNVLPRFFFFNGMKEIKPFKFLFATTDALNSFFVATLSEFPYVDHYNTGSSVDGVPTF